MRFNRAFVYLFVVLLCIPGFALAQNYSGTIRGTVTDPSGASVAGADVTVTHTATNASYTTKTSDQGEYVFPNLPAGVYDVRVKQSSFKEFFVKAVELHVASIAEVNAKLELGRATEVVTVEANAIQVQTATASVGEVVDGTQVRELPLNGRNFVQLTLLQPGVSDTVMLSSTNKGILGGVDFAVNGNPVTNNLFLLDGANNNDIGSNRTILIYPSLDSIAEFKILRNSYGPEYGQASGAVISITTLSGTNNFHGSVYYFGRNDALNANEFFANLNQVGKNELRRNDFGYTIGGPIKKDKLFFFFSEEWNREIRGQVRAACVPTAAEFGGDFSQDFTGTTPPPPAGTAGQGIVGTDQCNVNQPAHWVGAGPGGTAPFSYVSNIPVAAQASGNPFRIGTPSPAGLAIAQLLPALNKTGLAKGSNNWAQSLPSHINWREESIKLDYNLTRKHVLTFRYTHDSWENPFPHLGGHYWGDDPFPVVETSWEQPSQSIIGKATSTFGSLVNEAQFSYSHNAINAIAGGTNPGIVATINAALPTIYPAAQKQPGGQPILWSGIQQYGNFSTLWLNAPYANSEDLYAVRDDISKVRGTHILKAGAYFAYSGKNEGQNGGFDQPAFGTADWGVFTPTGNALANLLLPGQRFAGVQEFSVNPIDHARWKDFEFYVGDAWKVRRNLTVEYGIRWSFLREPYELNDRFSSFARSAYVATRPASDACNGVIIVPGTDPCGDANKANGTSFSSGTPGVSRALADNDNHAIAPRLGVAWDPWGDGKTAVRFGAGEFFQRERVGFQVIESSNAPFSVNAIVDRALDVAPPLSGAATSPSVGRSPRGILPSAWQWNFTVERQLMRDTTLEIGYVGNAGIHLSDKFDLNQVGSDPQLSPPANRVKAAFQSGGALNALRPMPTIGQILFYSRDGHSTYHSFQVLFRSRLKNRTQVQAAYTYSHSITNVELDDSAAGTGGGASTNLFSDLTNLGIDKGNSNINRPHIFTANAIFFLPKLANSSTFMRQALGGWEFSVITTAESGASLTVFNNGVSAVTGLTAAQCTAQGLSAPCSLSTLSGTGYATNHRPNIVPGVGCNSGVSGPQILNPAAFTLNGFQIGQIGNEPRGYCRGPDLVNADLALYKNWSVRERFKIQFRMEFFNAFNHAQFLGAGLGNLNTNWTSVAVQCGANPCSPSNNTITSSGSNNTNPVTGFGTTNLTRGPREIQYGLKFTF